MPIVNFIKRWHVPLLATLALFAVLLQLWKVSNLVTRLPSYGDVLENAWMLETAGKSLFERGQLPVFIPDVYYPQGWYATGWASGFPLYLAGAPMAWLISPAFAYNVLILAAFVVGYLGSLIWLRKHVNGWLTVALSIFITFANMHWFRVHGHLNIVWMLAWMPWLLHTLEQIYDPALVPATASATGSATGSATELATQPANAHRRWRIIRAGLFWSAMIHATPYGLFFGAAIAVPFLVVWLYRRGTRQQAVLIPAVAALVSLPYLALFYTGITYNGSVSYGLEHAQGWAVSLNALFVPSPIHQVPWVRQVATAIYSGPLNEANLSNLGISASVLALIGGVWALRLRGLPRLYVVMIAISLFLALGMVLMWNGVAFQFVSLHYLDNALWQVGRRIRPSAFNTVLAPGVFTNGVPLPGYLMHMLLPFTESARVWGRYANVMLLGMTPLIGLVLMRLPRLPQVLLSLLVIFEVFSFPTGDLPVPVAVHPAYEWVARQPAGAVLDMRADGFVLGGGEVVYAQRFHHHPMVNGLGSYLPPKLLELQNELLARGGDMSNPEFPRRASALGARYVLLHLQNPQQTADAFRANPSLSDVQCFAPLSNTIYLAYPICVATIPS